MKSCIAFLLALSSASLPAHPAGRADLPVVLPNDNRAPAGRLAGDTLTLSLVLDLARWYPEGENGPSVVVPALAEEGGAPRIPAPLIRVPAGTVVVVTVRNALGEPYRLEGLFSRPAAHAEPIALPAGSTRTVSFAAGEAGSYLYGALPAGYAPPRPPLELSAGEAEQASGALIIDPPGTVPSDRVLVINIWGAGDSSVYRNALTINGLSWPHTERMDAFTGDTIRWRVINASSRAHPMHMHGFYFTIEGRGDRGTYQIFDPSERRLAVTDLVPPYSTLGLSWVAARPGNWLFHCHLAFHVVPSARLDATRAGSHSHSTDPREHMAGLVLGLRVFPRFGYADADRAAASRRYLFAQEGARRGRAPRALGYVLQRGAEPPAPDSVEIPGTVLLFERGAPADVVVVNRLQEPVAIHWHGLELESWSDGVAGWSGHDSVVAPAIAPGDSFVARLTVPRAGTFIYHTHMNDVEQLTSGLYGAIVVLEPGRAFDPMSDHVIVMGWDGDNRRDPHLLINGDSVPHALELTAGAPHRLRFVNIGAAGASDIRMERDTSLVEWRRLALDGADLPAKLATSAPARHRIAVGQTADFEVQLPPGRYRLTYSVPRRTIDQPVVVR